MHEMYCVVFLIPTVYHSGIGLVSIACFNSFIKTYYKAISNVMLLNTINSNFGTDLHLPYPVKNSM